MSRFVYAMCSMDGKSGNEFLIATHSDLILTDAMWEQIHLFENPTGSKTEVKDLGDLYFCQLAGTVFPDRYLRHLPLADLHRIL